MVYIKPKHKCAFCNKHTRLDQKAKHEARCLSVFVSVIRNINNNEGVINEMIKQIDYGVLQNEEDIKQIKNTICLLANENEEDKLSQNESCEDDEIIEEDEDNISVMNEIMETVEEVKTTVKSNIDNYETINNIIVELEEYLDDNLNDYEEQKIKTIEEDNKFDLYSIAEKGTTPNEGVSKILNMILDESDDSDDSDSSDNEETHEEQPDNISNIITDEQYDIANDTEYNSEFIKNQLCITNKTKIVLIDDSLLNEDVPITKQLNNKVKSNILEYLSNSIFFLKYNYTGYINNWRYKYKCPYVKENDFELTKRHITITYYEYNKETDTLYYIIDPDDIGSITYGPTSRIPYVKENILNENDISKEINL